MKQRRRAARTPPFVEFSQSDKERLFEILGRRTAVNLLPFLARAAQRFSRSFSFFPDAQTAMDIQTIRRKLLALGALNVSGDAADWLRALSQQGVEQTALERLNTVRDQAGRLSDLIGTTVETFEHLRRRAKRLKVKVPRDYQGAELSLTVAFLLARAGIPLSKTREVDEFGHPGGKFAGVLRIVWDAADVKNAPKDLRPYLRFATDALKDQSALYRPPKQGRPPRSKGGR